MISLHNSITPVHPVVDEPELQQACCLLLYAAYHRECINNVLFDTNYTSFMEFNNVLSTVFSSCGVIAQRYIGVNSIQQMSTAQIMEELKAKIGALPLPPSLSKTKDFMKEISSIGLILEMIVSDWVTLQNVC